MTVLQRENTSILMSYGTYKFTDPNSSLLYSQKPATSPYCEPNKFSSNPFILLVDDKF